MEEGPECPEEVAYLIPWAWRLYGRSGGLGMAGLAPLSDMLIESWARQQRIVLEPYEVDALIYLDAAMREPDPPRQEDEDEEAEPVARPQRAWPSRPARPDDDT